MPWFRQPISWRIMQPDPLGPMRLRLRSCVDIEIERVAGDWITVKDFALVDSGASYTTISADWARAIGLSIPVNSSRLPVVTAAGRFDHIVHDGDIRIRFVRMPEVEFTLGCVFSENYSPSSPLLIGLHNILDHWSFGFHGESDPDAPMGHMRFETQ